jgi:hypothetical protein
MYTEFDTVIISNPLEKLQKIAYFKADSKSLIFLEKFIFGHVVTFCKF